MATNRTPDVSDFIPAAEMAGHLHVTEASLVRMRGIPYTDVGTNADTGKPNRLYDRVAVAQWLIERGAAQRQNRAK